MLCSVLTPAQTAHAHRQRKCSKYRCRCTGESESESEESEERVRVDDGELSFECLLADIGIHICDGGVRLGTSTRTPPARGLQRVAAPPPLLSRESPHSRRQSPFERAATDTRAPTVGKSHTLDAFDALEGLCVPEFADEVAALDWLESRACPGIHCFNLVSNTSTELNLATPSNPPTTKSRSPPLNPQLDKSPRAAESRGEAIYETMVHWSIRASYL